MPVLPLFLALACTCPAPTNAVPEAPRQVSVTATSRINVVPDEATVALTFSATAASMKKSHAASGASVEAFVAAVQALGVPKDALELCGTTDDPNYRWDGTQRITGYTSTTRLNVRTKDFEKVADIVDTAVQSGVTAVNVDYHSTTMPEHKKEARTLAIAAAKEKAEQLATGTGAHLGRIVTVAEGTTNSYGGYRSSFNNVAQTEVFESGESTGPVSPGTTPLELTITATFELD